MQFRCPNCRNAIQLIDPVEKSAVTINEVTCPSCHSQFNLSGEETQVASVMPGVRIQHFELQESLGQGAFGTVYKAWDAQLERTVAIKVPRHGAVSPQYASLFLKEARAAARVSHPNVVSVFEVGQHEGSYYIVSEFIDGISLNEWLTVRSLSHKDAARLMMTVCDAVQAAHDAGIIHRDLKPGNILMDQDSQPHVTDFGLARVDTGGTATVTHDGRIVGTPSYMAPEQANVDLGKVTQRTDVYALGVILFELLTGNRPFKATDSRTLLYRIQTEEPPRPRGLDRRIPRDLETIALHAMARDARARYASARDMGEDLRCVVESRPIRARPVPLRTRALRWVQRNRLISAAAVVTLSLAAVIALMWVYRPERDRFVNVTVSTVPAADHIIFVRCDPERRLPSVGAKPVELESSGRTVRLIPGMYRVIAWTDDGASHEVWRSFSGNTIASATNLFPHESWSVTADGTVELPSFQLFRDGDVEDDLIRIPGGRFRAGAMGSTAGLSPEHEQTVRELFVGVHEVSWGDLRRVLNRPVPGDPRELTYLQAVSTFYGDHSDTPDAVPVSGYPFDVAVLYCELAGGRLPTGIEYEYLATQGGQSPFPTGDSPVIDSVDEWKVVNVGDATADLHPRGIQNLYYSLAEYTDSLTVSYRILYPSMFPERPTGAVPASVAGTFTALHELRGAPYQWIYEAPTVADQRPAPSAFNVRDRVTLVNEIAAPGTPPAQLYARVGWRLVRSAWNDAPLAELAVSR